MANIKSAIKRIEVAKRNTLINKSKKSEIKTYIRQFEEAIEASDVDKATDLLKIIDRKLKRAALSSTVSKNKMKHTVSKLQKKLNGITAN